MKSDFRDRFSGELRPTNPNPCSTENAQWSGAIVHPPTLAPRNPQIGNRERNGCRRDENLDRLSRNLATETFQTQSDQILLTRNRLGRPSGVGVGHFIY